MSDRGEYRAIRRVLLDGPDFQRLPERARWVFVALKLNIGPAGIEVWYPAELVARLSAQTGVSAGGIQDALNTLEAGGWIRREGNVVWIVGQLANDPHVKQSDPKHRKMLQRHIAGMPRLDIVGDFVKAHTGWFTIDGTPIGAPSEGLAWAFEGPSEGHRSTKNKPKDEPNSLVPSGDGTEGASNGEYPTAFEAVWAIYPKRSGGNSKREALMAWRARLRSGVPAEVLHAGVERYLAFCESEQKVGSRFVMMAASFFGPGEHYLEPWSNEPAKADLPAARVLAATEMIL